MGNIQIKNRSKTAVQTTVMTKILNEESDEPPDSTRPVRDKVGDKVRNNYLLRAKTLKLNLSRGGFHPLSHMVH